MKNKKYSLLLASIGVSYSVTGKIDSSALPEESLCLASPLFHEDAKSCALVYTLLKNNFDLFDDLLLSKQITKMTDYLAAALLGGILHKANKHYFQRSIGASKNLTENVGPMSVKKTMSLLADFGKLPYDVSMQSLFKIKMNEIEAVDPKKILPRETIVSRNVYFAQRAGESSLDQFKRALCNQIIEIASKHELKQKEVGILMNASPAQINEIMKYRMDRFTIDFLIEKIQLLVNGLKSHNIAVETVKVPMKIGPTLDI
jgi:predicted XRE-type DNA-binding protein